MKEDQVEKAILALAEAVSELAQTLQGEKPSTTYASLRRIEKKADSVTSAVLAGTPLE